MQYGKTHVLQGNTGVMHWMEDGSSRGAARKGGVATGKYRDEAWRDGIKYRGVAQKKNMSCYREI